MREQNKRLLENLADQYGHAFITRLLGGTSDEAISLLVAETREITLGEIEKFGTPAKLTIRLEKGDIVIAKEDFEGLKKRS